MGGAAACAIIAGFGASAIYFFLLQRFAGKMITGSLILTVGLMLASAVFSFAYGNVIGGVLMLLMTALSAYAFYTWRFRIPFAKVLLKSVVSITRQFPATLFAGFVGMVLTAAYSFVWFAGVAGLVSLVDSNGNSPSGALYALFVYTIFVFYWGVQVIKNSVHLTVSGLFGTVYFMGVADQAGNVTVPVKNPTAASARRAMTTSFGSNCYGSLLIAIIQTLRALVQNARQDTGDNVAAMILLCCVQCILSCLQDMLEYFTKYAFTQVAIYGKDYCSAAKDTWQLVKTRGIDALINDNLIGSVMGMGSLAVGIFSGCVGAAYVAASTLPKTPGSYAIVVFLSFFIGMSEFAILAEVIDSGVSTTFVCIAEDPSALARTKPLLYQKIREVYPQALIQF